MSDKGKNITYGYIHRIVAALRNGEGFRISLIFDGHTF